MKIFSRFLLFLSLFNHLSLWAQTSAAKLTLGDLDQWSLEKLQQNIPHQEIQVYEPHSKELVTYIGFPIEKVFAISAQLANKWQQSDEILFTCIDGYQPSIPVMEFLNYKAHLVYAQKGNPSFTINNKNQNEKNVPLGPFYLVWDNITFKELKNEGASFWPYQISQISTIDFATRFPQLAPGKDQSQREGFLYFKKYCLSCHTLRDEGGKKAPDLSTIYKSYTHQWLQKFISDPRSVRPESTMSQLNPELPQREMVIEKILQYLKSKQINSPH